MNSPPPTRTEVNVVELNPHAPRPYVFTELALCLHDSIRSAGYVSNLYVNHTDASAISMILGAVPPLLDPIRQLDPSKTIIVNFEQLASNSSVATTEYRQWLRNWLVADYHTRNIEYLRRMNGAAQQILELPVVPGPSLAFHADLPPQKTVDVLFFGTPSDRRSEILRRLEAAGISVEAVAGAYGEELTPAIRRARIVLHVHFYETGLFPVARFLQPVIDGVPIVCEVSEFSALSDWSQSGILFAEYNRLVDACHALLHSPAEQTERAARTRHFAEQLDFATPFNVLLQHLSGMRAIAREPMILSEPQQQAAPPARAETQAQPAPTTTQRNGDEGSLSNAEIEAILEGEMKEQPPDSQPSAGPVTLVTRELGQGRLGRWAAWLLIAFSVITLWQSMR